MSNSNDVFEDIDDKIIDKNKEDINSNSVGDKKALVIEKSVDNSTNKFNLFFEKNKFYIFIFIFVIFLFSFLIISSDESKDFFINYLGGNFSSENNSGDSSNNDFGGKNNKFAVSSNGSSNSRGNTYKGSDTSDYNSESEGYSNTSPSEGSGSAESSDDQNQFTSSSSASSSSSNSGSNSGNTNSNNNNSSNSNSNQNSSNSDKDYSFENNLIKDRLISKYNIGIDLKNSHSDNFNYVNKIIESSYEINRMLVFLEKELSKYPEEFFGEFVHANVRYKLTFSFAKELKGNSPETNLPNEAIIDTLNSGTIKFYFKYISEKQFAKNFHYYMMKAIDYFMGIKYGSSKGYNWSSLNPVGFRYGNVVQRYNYNTNASHAYFFNDLTQMDEGFDRASIFSVLMTDLRTQTYFNSGHKIRNKALEIVRNLAATFSSCYGRNTINSWNPRIR